MDWLWPAAGLGTGFVLGLVTGFWIARLGQARRERKHRRFRKLAGFIISLLAIAALVGIIAFMILKG